MDSKGKYNIGDMRRTKKGNHLLKIGAFFRLKNGTYKYIQCYSALASVDQGSGPGNPHVYKTETDFNRKTKPELRSILALSMDTK